MSNEPTETRERRNIIREDRLTRPEKLALEERVAKPGATYTEVTWRKTAREDLNEIRDFIDGLDTDAGRATARRRGPRRRAGAENGTRTTGELPPGLRSRVTEHIGPVAYVQLVYSTKDHHVCRAGVREGEGHRQRIRDMVLLVGPEDIREVASVQAAVDGLPAVAPVSVSRVQFDAPGDELANLENEWVQLTNRTDRTIDLTGWTLRDEMDQAYNFPDGFKLAPGARVRVRTGKGTDGTTDLFWGRGTPVWNNEGDTAYLFDAAGELVDLRSSRDVCFARVQFDAPGPSAERDELEHEWVEIQNATTRRIELSGWMLADENDHQYRFPGGTALAPGARLRVRTGVGKDSATDLFWGRKSPVWNNEGDTALLFDPDGEVAARRKWAPAPEAATTSTGPADAAAAEPSEPEPVGPPVGFGRVQFDTPGDDAEIENLGEEWVEVVNNRSEARELSGWTISSEMAQVFTFPDGFELGPGARVKVRTGKGDDSSTDLHWGRGLPAWNNEGDTAYLFDADGELVDLRSSRDVCFAKVEFDAPGERHERDSLEREWVQIKNVTSDPVDLSGWTVGDAKDHRYAFPDGFTLPPGALVTLHTGDGDDSEKDLHWGSGNPIWNNEGDVAYLYDPEGEVAARRKWAPPTDADPS